jgi:hypothetical protein
MTTPQPDDEREIASWYKSGLADYAAKEGWLISECSGSEYGKWQVHRSDESDENHAQLNGDGHAWLLVLRGTEQHHVEALRFMRTHNPSEVQLWLRYVPKMGVALAPELLAAAVAATLEPYIEPRF